MKKSIRCCISCILPCGALDVIRIVHANGKVEEISGNIKASEIMKLHPKHVLKKPSSSSSSSSAAASSEGHVCPKIVIDIVPPDAQLQRGKIYFLIPLPNNSAQDKRKQKNGRSRSRKKREVVIPVAGNDADQFVHHHHHHHSSQRRSTGNDENANFGVSDRYLSEILSGKVSATRDRRRGRTAVWRPHLESISEQTLPERKRTKDLIEARQNQFYEFFDQGGM